jgi:NTE family protein
MRNMAPLSPVIHLGADKAIIIGVRPEGIDHMSGKGHPTPSRIFGYVLNSLFFDAIDGDVERLNHINELIKGQKIEKTGVRPVELLWIRPSVDIGRLAEELSSNLPGSIRYLLSGIGDKTEASELISHIMFEKEFTTQLIKIGEADARAMAQTILEFISK